MMENKLLVNFIIIYHILKGISAANILRIVLLVEEQQPEVAGWFADSVRELNTRTPEWLDLRGAVVVLDRENEEDSYGRLCATLNVGTSMVLDMTWTQWNDALQLTETWSIPLVSGMLGDGSTQLGALLQVLDLRNASDAVIIFQKENAMNQALYRLLGNTVLRIMVLHDFNNRIVQLRSMRPSPGHIVIMGDTDFVQDTYKTAVQEKVLPLSDRWILVPTDLRSHRLDVSLLQDNTSLLSIATSTSCLLQGLQESCKEDDPQLLMDPLLMAKMLRQLVDAAIVSRLHEVLTKPDCAVKPTDDGANNKEAAAVFFQDMEARVPKNETLLYWEKQRHGLYLRTELVYQTCKEYGLRSLGKWYSSEPLKLLPYVSISRPRRFFRIGVTTAIPWTYPKLDPATKKPIFNQNGQPEFEGYCIDLIAKLAKEMNFDYEIISSKSGEIGKKYPNGTWTGVIGDLVKGVTDIAVAATVMTSQREEVVDFVAPYFDQTGLTIVMRKPVRQTSLFKFMTVLKLEVWLSIVGALGTTAVLLTTLDRYSPYSARNNKNVYPYPCREFTLKESLWFAVTSFTPQGGGEAPKALSGRALVAAYWLFVVLMLATFTANLAAFLTVERMQSPVSSLEQLARQSRINYTVVEGGSAHQYFLNMKNAEDTLYRVWKEITLNASSDELQYHVWDYPVREQFGHILLAINSSAPLATAEDGFRKVNEREDADFAFIHDSAEIKYHVKKNCNLTVVGEVFGERPYAIAVQQGSRLQEELSLTVLQLQKDRFLDDLTAKYWNGSCGENDDTEGITLDSLGGVFIATLVGLALAMVTLVWEVIYYKGKAKMLNRKVEPVKAFSVPEKKESFTKEWAIKIGGRKKNNAVRRITIGDKFKPVKEVKKSKLSVLHVEPKLSWNP